MDINEIAESVRQTRKVSGLTQLELAQLAGVGKTSIFDIEKAKQTVQLKTLMCVLESLNIKLILDLPQDSYE